MTSSTPSRQTGISPSSSENAPDPLHLSQNTQNRRRRAVQGGTMPPRAAPPQQKSVSARGSQASVVVSPRSSTRRPGMLRAETETMSGAPSSAMS
jgi:hypothetical protein